MHLVVYEPADALSLAPFSLTRPVFALPLGIGTLLDRALRVYRPSRLSLWCRPQFAPFCTRLKLPIPFDVNAPLNGEPAVMCDGRSHAEYAVQKLHSPGLSPSDFAPTPDADAARIRRPWQLIELNNTVLREDAGHFRGAAPPAGPWHVLGDVRCAGEVKLSPGVVLDGTDGPILIGPGVTIGANAVIKGPAYLGPGCVISPLAALDTVRLGPRCKIGGECRNLVVIAHSNKAHDGYAGDTLLGEWVNIGAGTITSNLKNTYGPVRVAGQETGMQFLGSMVGDHTKTAIGTRLMTGTRIGPACMIASSRVPTVVPPLTFLTDDGAQPYQLDKAVDVARRVTARRGVAWTDDDSAVIATLATQDAQGTA